MILHDIMTSWFYDFGRKIRKSLVVSFFNESEIWAGLVLPGFRKIKRGGGSILSIGLPHSYGGLT